MLFDRSVTIDLLALTKQDFYSCESLPSSDNHEKNYGVHSTDLSPKRMSAATPTVGVTIGFRARGQSKQNLLLMRP